MLPTPLPPNRHTRGLANCFRLAKYLPMFEIASLEAPAGGASRIAVLPDIQNYTGHDGRHFEVLLETIDWLVAERARLGLALVLQLGDLTDRNRPDEWRRAREAFRRLDGRLPYVFTVGNHDLGRDCVGGSRDTDLNRHFALEQNPLNQANHIASWRADQLENRAQRVTLAGLDWLVLALEFGPREEVVDWADRVLARHRDHPTLLLTHEFVDQLSLVETGEVRRSTPDTFNSPACYPLAFEPGGASCGEDLWRRLVRPHPQVHAVLNGHYRPFALDPRGGSIPVPGLAEAHRRDTRGDGRVVEQIMFNAQWERRGGDGWLLLLEVSSGASIRATKFSPVRARKRGKLASPPASIR